MEIIPIKTHPIVLGDNIYQIIDKYLNCIKPNDIIIFTSKIISICEKNIIKNDESVDKYDLIKSEAEKYIQTKQMDKYHIMLTVNQGTLIASSGIDESNGNGYYVLWPKNPDASADNIWKYITNEKHIKPIGIIISDSKTTPLRWGTTGFGLSWSGFEPLNSYIGKPDIFGKKLRMTNASMLDGLAAAAVSVIGEGNEQTPIAIIRNAPRINFQNHIPSKKDRQKLKIEINDDIYAPILTQANWTTNKR